MKKFLVIAACGLACVASSAFAQVGLGGGVVGTLGANGSASSIGGLGSGISTGASARGADLRSSGQIGTTAPTPARSAASGAIDARANGNGFRSDTTGGGGTSAGTPIISGSSWGSAPSGAEVSGPDRTIDRR